MEIFFVRHTRVNVPSGICYGSTDVEVAESFNEEAHVVKTELDNYSFDKVYSSPMNRAKKLASYCGYSNAIIDSRISEFDFGDWELKSYNELYMSDQHFRKWCDDYINTQAPNGESLNNQIRRVESFISDVSHLGIKRACAFCHGGVLAIALGLSQGIKMKDAFKNIPPFGSIIRCEF